MTHKEMDNQLSSPWECIDPSLGACLGELELAGTTEVRTLELRAHLDLCDACRFDRALVQRLENGIVAGELELPRPSVRPTHHRVWWWRPAALATTGSSLIAACLALLMFLPPSPTGDRIEMRGGPGDARFLRPVEGEVVRPGSAVLSWIPVDGATSYRVTLTDADGETTWEESTRGTEIKLPVLDLGPDQYNLRAVLATVPADLMSNGQVSVCFSTGSPTQVARDRLVKAPLWLGVLALMGLILLGLSMWLPSRRSQVVAGG